MIISKSELKIIKAASNEGHSNGVIKLSRVDQQILLGIYVEYLLIYSSSNNGAAPASMSNLQEALAKALDIFFPLAGRYVHLESGALAVACNNSGVEFIEASSDTTLADALGDLSVHSPSLKELRPNSEYGEVTRIPLVVVQATSFPCGSLSLAVLVHHSFADAMAASSFVVAWSQLARGEPRLVSSSCFDRSLLQPNAPPLPKFPHPEYHAGPFDIPVLPALHTEMFVFSSATMQQLKEHSFQASSTSFTAFELLTALVWRSITTARQLHLQHGATTVLHFAVEGRKKLQLEPDYFGNAVFPAVVKAPAELLAKRTLEEVAAEIRAAKQRMTGEYMRSAVDWMELNPVSFLPPDVDVAVSSWSRFQFYGADFGFGQPSLATCYHPGFPGLLIILPQRPGCQDHRLVVGLEPEHMERLLADRTFTHPTLSEHKTPC